MKEYMVKIWGGAWNDSANPSIEQDTGIKEGTYYFRTKPEKNDFLKKLKAYEHLGLMTDCKEGEMRHKRTIAVVELEYEGQRYTLNYDFGYEYEEKSARFMFFDGNYSCDCNLSSFIQNECDSNFPELDCGDTIAITNFSIRYDD